MRNATQSFIEKELFPFRKGLCAMDKSALEQLLFKYDWWMGISTIAVTLGILGENVAHFIFEEEKRSLSEKTVSILFAVFVLGGVVGEYIFGSKPSAVSGQLQRSSDTEVASLNKEAGEARTDAGKANERAGKLEKGAAGLRATAEHERLARVEIEPARYLLSRIYVIGQKLISALLVRLF
jgi:hypothetical protein